MRIRYFTHILVSECGPMQSLEKGGHIANILTAVFTPVGTAASCYCAYVSWLGLHLQQTAQGGTQGAWSLNPHFLIAIFILSVCCGVGSIALLAVTLVRVFKKSKVQAPLKNEPTRPLKVPVNEREASTEVPRVPEKKPLTLPEIRPRIVAVSYSRIAAVPALEFIVANDGEPAYEVSIPEVQIGTSVMIFDGVCPRMKNRSTTEWRVLIQHDHRGVSTGNSLRDEMLRQGVGEIAVPIRYKDGNGLWYISHCRIALSASAKNGLTVHNDGQELVSGKQVQVPAAFPDNSPRPYPAVEDPIDDKFGKTFFHFTNSGKDVAHNVQVQPLDIDNLTATFDPIPIIHVNGTGTTIPSYAGGIGSLHDIIRLMEREWDRAIRFGGMPDDQPVTEWVKEVTATYEDFRNKKFKVTFDLVAFPPERMRRAKDALKHPGPEYRTVEVRHVNFRVV